MAATRLTIRGRRVVTPDGVRPATVQVVDGMIVALADVDEPLGSSDMVFDAGRNVVAPGLVDIHVHVNDPGRTEWEGFESATRAAAAGGVTTLLDMPLNCVPPTVSVEALEAKRAAAEGRCHVDVGFWGGIVPGNLSALRDLHAAGVFGFKAFLADSGIEDFPAVSCEELEEAMAHLHPLGALTAVHAEDAELLAASQDVWDRLDPRSYAAYLASRPDEAELRAVEDVVGLARRTGGRAHVLHLSSATALGTLREAADMGANVTAETCPHYLALQAGAIPDGATAFKCAPPIRDGDNQDRLWGALADGTISVIASDHSPCTPDLKRLDDGDFRRAWGGIASLQLGLVVTWTQARLRGLQPQHVSRWMSTGPAELVGLHRKGALKPGNDADIVIWDPEATHEVDGAALLHRHHVTPYHGMRLRGHVLATFLRGEVVYEHGQIVGPPAGRLLVREDG